MTVPSLPGATVVDDELQAIESAAREAYPEYLDDLRLLVDIDCGTYTKDGVDRVGRWAAGELARLGARVTTHPEAAFGDTVVGTFDGTPGGLRALLIGHLDTVFDAGTVAERPFRVEGGRALGPGVSDMKGGFLVALYALRALGRLGLELPFERLVFVANPDEEIGSPVSSPWIRELAATSDVCFVFEAARANGDIVSARKGCLDLRLTVHGRAAHAGVEPEKGRSAIVELAHQVRELTALNGRWPGVTVNVGVVGGGTRPNVVAESARLDVDVRSPVRASLEAAEAAIRASVAAVEVPDVTIDVEVLSRWWPMEKLAASARLVEHAQALATRLGFQLADASTGGASDANTTSGLGVPSLDGLGPIGGNDHAPGEYVELDSVVPRTALAAALLLAVGRDESLPRRASGA